MNERNVKRIVTGHPAVDGAGVKLIRVLGPDDIKDVNPFLMMDAFGSDNPEDYIKGFPMHPHRGIETITYLLEGRIDHRDSIGNEGTLKGGELQWMTSGSGILHEEMPQESKRLTGLQFWLNLSAKDKMTAPAYFPITPEMIKEVVMDGAVVRVIAGDFDGHKGVAPPHVPVNMLDITLEPDREISIPILPAYHAFAYMFEGNAYLGSTPTMVGLHDAAILTDGDSITAKAGPAGSRFVLLAGQPLDEPVAWAGPIVMNTQEELNTAFKELSNGTFIK